METAGFSSQEKLDQMLHDGKINRQEYDRLCGALEKSHGNGQPDRAALPWQIWVVIAMLALEGLGNLAAIPQMPVAAVWLAAKFVLILGLWKGWKPVYILAIVLAVIHALYFAQAAPAVSLLNALLVILLITGKRFYFPATQNVSTERP